MSFCAWYPLAIYHLSDAGPHPRRMASLCVRDAAETTGLLQVVIAMSLPPPLLEYSSRSFARTLLLPHREQQHLLLAGCAMMLLVLSATTSRTPCRCGSTYDSCPPTRRAQQRTCTICPPPPKILVDVSQEVLLPGPSQDVKRRERELGGRKCAPCSGHPYCGTSHSVLRATAIPLISPARCKQRDGGRAGPLHYTRRGWPYFPRTSLYKKRPAQSDSTPSIISPVKAATKRPVSSRLTATQDATGLPYHTHTHTHTQTHAHTHAHMREKQRLLVLLHHY